MRGPRVYQDQSALSFANATSNRVALGTGSIINDIGTGTILVWAYVTVLTAFDMFLAKFNGGTSVGWYLEQSDALGNLQVARQRATTAQTCTTTDVPLVINTWFLFAGIFDTVNNAPAIYWGTIAQLAKASAVTTVAGSGALKTDVAIQAAIGNNSNTTPNRGLHGRVAVASLFNRALSLPEIQAWQMSAFDEPFPAITGGCVGLWYPGAEGLNTVIDYSGFKNTGSISGATAARGPSFPVADLRRRLVA